MVLEVRWESTNWSRIISPDLDTSVKETETYKPVVQEPLLHTGRKDLRHRVLSPHRELSFSPPWFYHSPPSHLSRIAPPHSKTATQHHPEAFHTCSRKGWTCPAVSANVLITITLHSTKPAILYSSPCFSQNGRMRSSRSFLRLCRGILVTK